MYLSYEYLGQFISEAALSSLVQDFNVSSICM